MKLFPRVIQRLRGVHSVEAVFVLLTAEGLRCTDLQDRSIAVFIGNPVCLLRKGE